MFFYELSTLFPSGNILVVYGRHNISHHKTYNNESLIKHSIPERSTTVVRRN